MSANVALGEIEWLGKRRNVEVIISESNDALIGTEMFDGATPRRELRQLHGVHFF